VDGSYYWNEMIIHKCEAGSFWEFTFFCPGCKCGHGFKTSSWPMPSGLSEHQQRMFNENNWGWNGDFGKPTISPSLNVLREIGKNEKGEPVHETICHSHVISGEIQFLGDCKHELRSKTVPLEEF